MKPFPSGLTNGFPLYGKNWCAGSYDFSDTFLSAKEAEENPHGCLDFFDGIS
jgi:hypothetical protein